MTALAISTLLQGYSFVVAAILVLIITAGTAAERRARQEAANPTSRISDSELHALIERELAGENRS